MSTEKGCKFCIRHGLPILPVRPAVVAKDDTLPHLPASIVVPTEAKGETAWTGRLLREGYLYIWSELGKRWINYFATSEGYYYPLPENGDVPPDIINGKVKPCITQPAELASASLITLPVKPAGMKNGLFWFAWSEVEWTDAVRKKHEDAGYRSQYMQSFDMDTWIKSGKADQVLPLAQLSETVAEYSSKASSSKVKKWPTTLWKVVKPLEGANLLQAANKLYANKGAMILLQDPAAVLQGLSTLINLELQKEIYEKPEYQRELVLSSAITGLKTSLIRQFERDFIDKSENEERLAIYGPYGFSTPGPLPDNMYTHINDAKMKSAVARKWSQYEQYYEPAKVAEFQRNFNDRLTRYNNTIISPREDMYLACMKSSALLGYFQHNFDIAELGSGIDYVQTLNYCIAGMQDKIGASLYFQTLLIGKPTDVTNILARALVLNQTALATKLEEGVQGSVDLFTLPWSSVADAFNTTITRIKDQSAGVMGIFFGLMAGPLTAKLQSALESKEMFHVVVSMGAFTNKAIVSYEKRGTYKQFVTEVVGKLAKDSGLNGKTNGNRLRTYVSKELRRLRIDGLPMEGTEMKRFLVMIDIDKVNELKILPPKERAIALSKLLRVTGDVEAEQFTRWQGGVQRGMTKTGQAMPFALGVVSGILQTVALWKTAGYKASTLTAGQTEAFLRFWAGVVAASSTSLAIIETGIRQFNLFTNTASKLNVLSSEKFLRWVNIGAKFLGVVGGVVAVGFDLYHAVDEFNKGHKGLAAAYLFSAISGIWLTAAIFSTLPVIGTVIATIFLIGAAIYLAIYNQDNIQKWLGQCLWRKIPVNPRANIKKQEEDRKYEEASLPIWPTMQMEMHELTLALGEGA